MRQPQLRLRGRTQGLRQHHHAILVTLARPHDQGLVREVHVLHPQAQCLAQAHAGAVQQPAEQTVLVRQGIKEVLDLARAQHHRQAPPHCGPADLLQPRQLNLQHPAVQKQQRRERLVVRGGRELPIGGQCRPERLHLCGAHLRRVAQAKKADELLAPAYIELFRAQAVVQPAQALPQTIQQSSRLQCRQFNYPCRPPRWPSGRAHGGDGGHAAAPSAAWHSCDALELLYAAVSYCMDDQSMQRKFQPQQAPARMSGAGFIHQAPVFTRLVTAR